MAEPDARILAAVHDLIVETLRDVPQRPVVIGLCGTQASGKSTLARALEAKLSGEGIATATLSLDDLYLTHAERAELARTVHPLLATRGVPGTHDIALGLSVIAALRAGEPVALPRFDKGRDDRAPRGDWPNAPQDCAVLLFEGWCVGATPQEEAALAEPVNALERDEDAGGQWRAYANAQLAGDYQRLFGTIDRLVLLAAPGFEAVFDWRMQQEQELVGRPGARVMDAAGLARFISHYERLTRHILHEMPARADLLIEIDRDRAPLSISRRS